MTMASAPDMVETEDGRFFLTEHEGTTLGACVFGPDHRVREYWHEIKGDAIRLYRLDDGRYFID